MSILSAGFMATAGRIAVDSRFDGGNGDLVGIDDSLPRARVDLAIRTDAGCDFRQWFHVRLSGIRGRPVQVRILNAGTCTYPRGFKGYRPVISTDRQRWTRVQAAFDGMVLSFDLDIDTDQVDVAYFAPYDLSRHADLVARIGSRPGVERLRLGTTVDGRPLDALKVGAVDTGRPVCWIIGRQHPGETMASWWMEGALERLTDPGDAVASRLRSAASFVFVPNMNPDGSARGHLRANAAGANLNREWLAPSLARSPEVAAVRQAMIATGVAFCLDVHGDEALPHNFIAGFEGIPDLRPGQLDLLADYRDRLDRISPDFQTRAGYPPARPQTGNLTVCTNWVANTFGTLAMTLEQPFKDCAEAPDAQRGWSPDGCRRLAGACLDALAGMTDRLTTGHAT
ncbi:M14-type cytosolic carboxypeptidase [Tistrella sp. BH-R2-4]|uniref:M14-type cytosolic carboxypeptidase n=2 Tax=Geminicoccaceae TaxID=2066434 RepID=A0ABU9YT43_9PROT